MEEKVRYHSEMVNGYAFRMRYLPGGIFDMGSNKMIIESPIHKVELSSFYIGEYLVTQALWKAVMGVCNNTYRFRGDLRPVEQVSWLDIVEGNQDGDGQPAFLQRLNEATEGTRLAGHVYRLPTEAEWEYAARGGEPYEYAGSDQLKQVGWYGNNSHGETKAVGLKCLNGFQLYDMSGNIMEWCKDNYSDSFYQECHDKGIVKDPLFEKKGDHDRVIRGGSWGNGPRICCVSSRFDLFPTDRDEFVGFRLVLAPVQRS